MRQSFIKRIWQKPPVLFPWVALFHIVMMLFSIWNYRTEPILSLAWVQPLWIVLYTITWVFVCDMKKWAALVYIGLTTLNLFLRFWLSEQYKNDLTDTLFPLDVLFTFFVMFYFKRFD
jgi:hypothetical protein